MTVSRILKTSSGTGTLLIMSVADLTHRGSLNLSDGSSWAIVADDDFSMELCLSKRCLDFLNARSDGRLFVQAGHHNGHQRHIRYWNTLARHFAYFIPFLPGSNVVYPREKTWSPSFEEVEQKRAFEA